MVRKIPTQQHLSQHQVIEFTEVINNFGNVYDTNFHFFNAPKPGLYYFTCTLTSYQSERLNFELAKNGALVVKGYAADEKQSVCATVSAYLHLEKNDKVWIRNGDNSINSDSMVYGNYYSSFLGFKIQ
ncbi:hypothetical protein FSP39_019338 [Pinctada imbricata]|uniref:C1q domain-containing protein n=1 Tax=Pinctada imbricata TaxID=66713 RepID=A0AA88Y0U8_PINIB|nr:hypothetical protein FSP39_019338 [Pinctada imbricata]